MPSNIYLDSGPRSEIDTPCIGWKCAQGQKDSDTSMTDRDSGVFDEGSETIIFRGAVAVRLANLAYEERANCHIGLFILRTTD